MKYSGEIHVLQHNLEVGHAKNSLKLAQQLMPDIQIWQGESETDFSEIAQRVNSAASNWACFYPHHSSIENNEHAPHLPDTHLIFIDATWRKARKIWHLNSWLHNIPLFHLSPDYIAQYRIRKNHQPHQLSTLEAIAHAIRWQTDSTPLLSLFDEFQDQTRKFYEEGKINKNSHNM